MNVQIEAQKSFILKIELTSSQLATLQRVLDYGAKCSGWTAPSQALCHELYEKLQTAEVKA